MVPRAAVRRWLIFVMALLLTAVSVVAQPDTPTDSFINLGTPVSDMLTEVAFFDVWRFAAVTGEHYRAVMQGADGLAPLVGLRDPGGDVLTASNFLDDGTIEDAPPNGTATLLFEVFADGEYALIASRAGLEDGTTTGSYTLSLELLSGPPIPDDTYVDVEFRCGADIATTAAVLEFGDRSERNGGYRVTAYGFDGFDPVLRLGGDFGETSVTCTQTALSEDELAIQIQTDAQTVITFGTARITALTALDIPLPDGGPPVRVTLGSRAGKSGMYVLHVEGLGIESEGDTDTFVFRNGPLAKDQPVMLWMLHTGLTRLDSMIVVPEELTACADVQLRTCGDLRGTELILLVNGQRATTTDRLDSAARIRTDNSDPIRLALMSQNRRSTGAYSVWLYGKLPAQSSDEP